MILYHGTNVDFDKIELLKSKPNKDFGRGFYLSSDYQQAKELAEARTELSGGQPIVLKYQFDETLLTSGIFKVLQFKDYSKEWATFVLANRNNYTNKHIHDYDIVIGPIANDKVGRQLWRYKNHDIDMSTLIQNLKYMKGITYQYLFGSERAIQYLEKI